MSATTTTEARPLWKVVFAHASCGESISVTVYADTYTEAGCEAETRIADPQYYEIQSVEKL